MMDEMDKQIKQILSKEIPKTKKYMQAISTAVPITISANPKGIKKLGNIIRTGITTKGVGAAITVLTIGGIVTTICLNTGKKIESNNNVLVSQENNEHQQIENVVLQLM